MTVRGLPVPEPERYITRTELADLMSVSVRTIDYMVAEGMPSVRFGPRTRRFLASKAVAWARQRNEEAA